MFDRPRLAVQTHWCWEGLAYLAVLIAILVGALVREINLLFMLAGLMTGPLLWSWWWGRNLVRSVSVRRRFPRSVCAGDLLLVELEVVHTARRGACWALVIEDGLSQEDGRPIAPSVKIYLPFLAPGARQTAGYQGRLPQRGRYQFGPLRIHSRFPFGLFRHTLQVGQEESLVVYPRVGRLTRRWTARQQQSFEGLQRREHRSARREGDFYGVRPWHSGDRRRWIHWRASARHQTLVVRQFEEYRNRDLLVLLRLQQPASPPPTYHDDVEWAVSFAATLITEACRKGVHRVGLAIAGREPVWLVGPPSTGLLDEAMEHLALARPSSEDSFADLFPTLTAHFQRSTQMVVILPAPADPPVWEAWKNQFFRRLPGFAIFFVDVTDPQFQEYFLPP